MRKATWNTACGLCLLCCGCSGGESGTASVGIGSTNDASVTTDTTVTSAGESTSTNTTASGTTATTSTSSGGATSASTTSGSTTTGAGAGGTSGATGGSAGTSAGGTGGANTSGGGNGPLECDEVTGQPASCDVTEDSNCCTRCVASLCCSEYAACFAQDPANVCGGGADSDSEAFVFIDCMLNIQDGAIPADVETCAAEASANVSGPLCGAGSISPATNDLIACMAGDQGGLGGCFEECLRSDFEEAYCGY